MKLHELREQAWENPDQIEVAGCPSEVESVKELPGDWTISFAEEKPPSGKSRSFFTKTFYIPSQEYGTAFKLRIKKVEQAIDHHCYEIKAVPENRLRITLATKEADSFTDKDAKLAAMINQAYDPYETNKAGNPNSKKYDNPTTD